MPQPIIKILSHQICHISKYPELLHIVVNKKNLGLGLALNVGLKACRNELVARMDTDDIARKDRFERQLEMFENNSELDICGSHIKEFEGTPKNIISKRCVPINEKEIYSYQKRRDSFNHMTVMYKKSKVLEAGNYQSCMLMEDTYLWGRMILVGATFINIDDYLVYARVGNDMFERRGGYSYYKKYKIGRKKVRETGYIGRWDYYYSLIIQFFISVIPNNLRGWIFKNFLHSNFPSLEL